MKQVELSVSDPVLQEMFPVLQELRQGMRELFLTLVGEQSVRRLGNAEWAAIALLARSVEVLESVELLLGFERVRDASILLLTMLELDYDLHYISLDASRADDWLSHSEQGRKPWRIAQLQDALYDDPGERAAVKDVYRDLSMVKHGNPVSRFGGFPVVIEGRFTLADFSQQPHAVASYIHIGALVGRQTAEHAIACFHPAEQHLKEQLNSLKLHCETLSRAWEAQIVRLFQDKRPSSG